MNSTVKFSSKTLIGNWKEEVALEEAKAEAFRQRTNDGSGNWKKLQFKMQRCEESVPMTYSEDGFVKFGDFISLQHIDSSHLLSCDPFEEVLIGQDKFFVSGINSDPDQPKARSVYTIVRPPEHLQNYSDDQDDLLHVGQAFQIQCNPSLLVSFDGSTLGRPMFVCSTKKNERTAIKGTNRQMVYLSPDAGPDSIWTAIIPSQGRKNGPERLLKMGEPCTLAEGYIFAHRQTNMYITLDSATPSQTEFGVELECSADRSTAFGKLGLMVSEAQGWSTPATLSKPDGYKFYWSFKTASSPALAIDNRQLPPVETIDWLLDNLCRDINIHGGIQALETYFDNIQAQLPPNKGKMDREDLKASIIAFINNEFSAGGMSGKSLDVLIDLIDFNKVGLIDVADFMKLIQSQ